MIVQGYNPSVDNLEHSYLSADYAAGVTALTLRNNDNFSDDDFILLGQPGSENAEIVQITAAVTAGTDITVGATKFPHSASDPVYVLNYNQIKFYRSTTTIDDTYSLVATVGIDVDNPENKTLYDDATGLTSYFYKISFYNSATTVESSLSDPIPGSGYARKQVGSIVNDFLTEINDLQQEYMTVPQILSLMNEVNDDIRGQSRKPMRFLKTTALATITEDEEGVDLPEDMHKFDRVRYTRTDVAGVITKKTLTMVDIEEMQYGKYEINPLGSITAADVYQAAIDDVANQLILNPTPTTTQANALTIIYYAEMSSFTSLADLIQLPTPRIYKLFLLGRYYLIRAKKETSFLQISDRYLGEYRTEIVKLQRDQRVDVGSTMSMKKDTRTSHGLRG